MSISKKIPMWILWICLPLFNTLNQVAMKMTASVLADDSFGWEWLVHAASTPYIWGSFVCEVISFVLWLAILKRQDVSQAFPLTALSYVALMITSWAFFKEEIQAQQFVGIVLILCGILVLSRRPPAVESAS